MSGYGKSSQQPDYGTRNSQSQQYSGLSQAPYGASFPSQPHYAPSVAPSLRLNTQRPASELPAPHSSSLGEHLYSPRHHYDQPVVVESSPRAGKGGAQFTVCLQSSSDLTTDPRSFFLVFGGTKCKAAVSKDAARGADVYQLNVEIPLPNSSTWQAPQLMVFLVIEEEGHEAITMEVGNFTYSDTTQQNYTPPARPQNTRKRKSSADDGLMGSPAKRHARQPIRPKSEDFGAYGYHAQNTGRYSTPVSSSSSNDRNYTIYSAYEHQTDATQTSGFQPQASPRQYLFPYGAQSEGSHQQSSTTATWPSADTGARESQLTPSPTRPTHGALSPEQARAVPPSPSNTGNPTLIRTSTIQNVAGAAGGGSSGGPSFNPYSIYPHKAVLEIQGDLNDMATRWSSEEWESSRRLVQFWRQQKGNTIVTTFRPVAPNEKPPGSIIVSCIWWAEKQECYITSVDCISLLESLVAVRFTVEEKNRIRRNLEGFRPLTVSKAKQDSENFFKLIMAFPSPKPRNIEKDVKVFKWVDLAPALKKIISKYSASYSSTASVIPPSPGNSTFPEPQSGEPSHTRPSDSRMSSSMAPVDSILTTAPPSAISSMSTTSLPGVSRSPNGTSRGSISSTVSVSLAPQTINSWPQPSLATAPQSVPPPPPLPRAGTWDTSTYLGGPASAPPMSTQAIYYQRGSVSHDREPLSAGAQPTRHLPNGP